MTYVFEIPGTLPTLNEYVRAERSDRQMAARMKREAQEAVCWALKGAATFPGHVFVAFDWVRPDMRCDKDNVAFAKKFVLDALQQAGVIRRDSWRLCTPFDRSFRVSKESPRTVVSVSETFEELMGDGHA